MSEAEAAIIKPDGSPYVTVFVSDSEASEAIADENENSQVIDARQIIVHPESVTVEDYNDIHCVIAQENVKFESLENEELSNDSSRTLWTSNNVRLLINEYKALQHEFQDPRRKQKDLWATLAARLSEKVAKEDGEASSWMASHVTWDACDRKWRNLKHTFKTIHTNQWRSFRSRSRWEFYTPLLEIFGSTIDSSQPMKNEKTRYLVVHPTSSQDGERHILVPAARKLTGCTRQAELSAPQSIISPDDGSGEETVFVEEVKMDDNGTPGFVVMKASKMSSSCEPLKKQIKLSHVMEGQVKIGVGDDENLMCMDRDNESSSKGSSSKMKEDDSILKESTGRTNPLDVQEAVDKSSDPPVWFIKFLKEYQEEENKRREALRKTHEELLQVEERKVKALENILKKISSGKLSNSSKSDSSMKCEK